MAERAARKFGGAARRIARRWPLTASGAALLAAGAGRFAVGRARMDLVFTLVGLLWIGLLLLDGALVAAAAIALQLEVRRASSGEARFEGVEGAPGRGGLEMPRRALPLVARPRALWLEPAADAEFVPDDGWLREEVRPRGRWNGTSIVREIAQEDLLGLWRVSGRFAEARPSFVLPDPGAIAVAELAACLASGDLLSHPWGPARGDLIDARPYTRSDPARLILWKVYARSRRLVVRAPEQARAPERRPLVYLVAGEGDDAAAAAARVVVESALLGEGMRFAADGAPRPAADCAAALAAVAGSAAHRGRGGADLAAALADPLVEADDPVLLIVPARLGDWAPRVFAAVGAAQERFVALLCADVRPESRPGGAARRILFAQERPAGPTWDEMRASARLFAAAGVRAALLDRRAGRIEALEARAEAR